MRKLVEQLSFRIEPRLSSSPMRLRLTLEVQSIPAWSTLGHSSSLLMAVRTVMSRLRGRHRQKSSLPITYYRLTPSPQRI
jgi:hypothetical protein